MSRSTNRTWFWLAIAAIALGGATYAYFHAPLRDDTELRIVALDPTDPERTQVGELTYLGGIDIPRLGQNVGGLSGLRWDAASGRLLAITDDARWMWLSLEEGQDRLTGLSEVDRGPLIGLNGEPLSGKAMGDSESLSRSKDGGWLVGFERTHRVWRYPNLKVKPIPLPVDLEAEFGSLEENGGLEAIAGNELSLSLCVERRAATGSPNCQRRQGGNDFVDFAVQPPKAIADLGAVPTDADALSDGGVVVLFRIYSPVQGNSAGIVKYGPGLERVELATLRPPLSTDNFEGLAIREENGRTFLYIVSDDNFSGRQRTLLMKFEMVIRSEQ